MKATIWKVVALVVTVAALWFGWAAWRAHSNLVTLHVRNADLREVVSKIEWQTWAQQHYRAITSASLNAAR